MPVDPFLPATPALRRIARDYLGFDPWSMRDPWRLSDPWWEGPYSDGTARLPLSTGAGLAITRLRLAEVAGPRWDTDHPPEEMARVLREMDPELRDAR